MDGIQARFVDVELYFDNLERARKFYIDTMGLEVSDEQGGHGVKFESGAGFVCLERKGVEPYTSKDKAVLFFEILDLSSAIAAIGRSVSFRRNLRGPCCTIPKVTTFCFFKRRPKPRAEVVDNLR